MLEGRERDRVLEPFVDELKSSLEKRFAGLLRQLEFDVIEPSTGREKEPAFSSECYLVAAFLDPEFRDLWVDKFIPANKQAIVKARVRESIFTIMYAISGALHDFFVFASI